MLTSLDTITNPEGCEYLRLRKVEIMERRARQSRQPPVASSFGNFNNINQFQGGSQGPFNSGNFANPFQFPTRFGGYGNHHGEQLDMVESLIMEQVMDQEQVMHKEKRDNSEIAMDLRHIADMDSC